MPVAGNRAEDRAKAHARWAERYSRAGNVDRAVAHFGRAVEYNRRSGLAPRFGIGDVSSALTSLAPAAVTLATAAAGAAAAAVAGAVALSCAPGSQCTARPQQAACDLCETGGPIDSGVHGRIYNMRGDPAWVVKVFNNHGLAHAEYRMMSLMHKITRLTNGAFRSLNARLVPSESGPVQLLIERYERPVRRYLFDTKKTKAEDLRKKDKVELSHLMDIRKQFEILHSFGIGHGDAHGGNIGLVVKDDQRYFVIADPTQASESTLSDLTEVRELGDGQGDMTAVEYAALKAVHVLRAAMRQGNSPSGSRYKYSLNMKITDLDTDEAVLALMKHNGIRLPNKEDTDEVVSYIGGLVDDHNKVVDLMKKDMGILKAVMPFLFEEKVDPKRRI